VSQATEVKTMELNGVQKCMLRRTACGEGYDNPNEKAGWGLTSSNSIGRIDYFPMPSQVGRDSRLLVRQ